MAAPLRVQRFEDTFLETPVYFLLVTLQDTYFLWVGSAPPRLDHMSVAIPTRFDAQPSTSTVLGSPTLASAQNEFGLTLAKHLGRRTKKMFVVSCSLSDYSQEMQIFIERRLRGELAAAGSSVNSTV